jgi:hypothetical protein
MPVWDGGNLRCRGTFLSAFSFVLKKLTALRAYETLPSLSAPGDRISSGPGVFGVDAIVDAVLNCDSGLDINVEATDP